MRQIGLLWAAAILFFGFSASSNANVLAKIDLSAQQMRVYVHGELRYTWPVSTGRRGYRTPTGSYRPTFLSRFHRSRKYYNSPMPHSVFFRGGYAIHGTYAVRRLGRRASHGCIRLHPQNARHFFGMVKRFGKSQTRIVITH